MRTHEELVEEPFPYYLGYTHFMFGFHLWRDRSLAGDVSIPAPMLDLRYVKGYDDAKRGADEQG